MYLLWSRGFTSGGFNAELDVLSVPEMAPLPTYDPQTMGNFELGFKSTLLNRRMQLNLSVFRMDYSDKQESISVDNSDGRFGPNTTIEVISNAAEAEIEGFELKYIFMLGERFRDGAAFRRRS